MTVTTAMRSRRGRANTRNGWSRAMSFHGSSRSRRGRTRSTAVSRSQSHHGKSPASSPASAPYRTRTTARCARVEPSGPGRRVVERSGVPPLRTGPHRRPPRRPAEGRGCALGAHVRVLPPERAAGARPRRHRARDPRIDRRTLFNVLAPAAVVGDTEHLRARVAGRAPRRRVEVVELLDVPTLERERAHGSSTIGAARHTPDLEFRASWPPSRPCARAPRCEPSR